MLVCNQSISRDKENTDDSANEYEQKKSVDKKCPRNDTLTDLQCMEQWHAIVQILTKIQHGYVMKTTELLFLLKQFLEDDGERLSKIFKENLMSFGTLIDDIIDGRIQDERDVTLHTQNIMYKRLSQIVTNQEKKIAGIIVKLYTISSTFDWKSHGKNPSLVSTLIMTTNKSHVIPRIRSVGGSSIHRLFARCQWMKYQLCDLQKENNNLENVLEKIKKRAIIIKSESTRVPRMLIRELKIYDNHLKLLKHTYTNNIKKIQTLYVENDL